MFMFLPRSGMRRTLRAPQVSIAETGVAAVRYAVDVNQCIGMYSDANVFV